MNITNKLILTDEKRQYGSYWYCLQIARPVWQKVMLGVYILVLDWHFALGQGREENITAFAACDFELSREMGFEINNSKCLKRYIELQMAKFNWT